MECLVKQVMAVVDIKQCNDALSSHNQNEPFNSLETVAVQWNNTWLRVFDTKLLNGN
jgi:hypothetical protein